MQDIVIYPQVLKNARVTDKDTALNDPDVQAEIAAVTERLGDNGRILVRKSGTEPVLRVLVVPATWRAASGTWTPSWRS